MNETIIFCAFRYALGRSTYVVSVVVQEIIKEWNNLHSQTKRNIKTEINEAIDNNYIGMDIDEKEWLKILNLKQ